MSIACESVVCSRTEDLPAMSMLMPIDGITAAPPAWTSSVEFAKAAQGASSARAANRKSFMHSSLWIWLSVQPTPASRPPVVTDSRQPKDVFDVVLVKFFAIGLADRQLVRDFYLFGDELVRIVHRVHHALDAQHRDAELDRRRPLHAAGGDPDVLLEIIAHFHLQRPYPRIALRSHHRGVHEVDAEQPEGQALAEVADHHAQLREAVENPA